MDIGKDKAGTEEVIRVIGREAALLTEYNALRREIEIHITERRRVESHTLIAVGLLYSWVFTRGPDFPDIYFSVALSIAPVLTILSFLRWLSIQSRTVMIGRYLATLEMEFDYQRGGWENYLNRERTKNPLLGRPEGWTEFLVWALLLSATVGVVATFPVDIPNPTG